MVQKQLILGSIRKTLTFTALFLLSTLSHTFIPWLAASLLLFSIQLLTRDSKQAIIYYCKWFYFGLAIIVLYGIKFLTIDEDVDIYFLDAFINKFIYLCVILFSGIAIYVEVNRNNLLKFLPLLISIHVIIFYIQFITYYATGYYLDFVYPITGEESRYKFFETSNTYSGIIRATGFYVEPSTYTGAISCLFGAYLVLIKRTFNILTIFTLLSMFLSLATSGIIIASLFTLYLLICNSSGKTFLLTLIFCVLAAVVFGVWFDTIMEYLNLQIDKFERGAGARTGLLPFVLGREGLDVFIGKGPFYFEKEILYKLPITGDGTIVTINDSGLVIFLMLQFGILGAALFLCWLFFQLKLKGGVWIYLIVGLSKIAIYHPVFIFYLILTVGNQNFKRKPSNASK